MALGFFVVTLRSFQISSVVERSNRHLKALGVSFDMRLSDCSGETWGQAEAQAVGMLGEVAAVSLRCHCAPVDVMPDDEGGCWFSATIDRLRTGASALLAVVVAAAVAEEVDGVVLDEWSAFGEKRDLLPSEILDALKEVTGVGDLETLGRRLGAMLGIPD